VEHENEVKNERKVGDEISVHVEPWTYVEVSARVRQVTLKDYKWKGKMTAFYASGDQKVSIL
jgi:flavodoxin